MDADDIRRTLLRLAYEVMEKNPRASDLALIGVHRRGVHLADRISAIILDRTAASVPCGSIDITFYRDDLTRIVYQPQIQRTEIHFSLDDLRLVLVDDVISSGRTVRAAMDALLDIGRPRSIQLAVLVDRGHRELPIRPDYVGKNIPTSLGEQVQVHLTELDGQDEVVLLEGNDREL
jgi:pyrimidine operon attenuation protein/uracil phosphoribosyltransferase